MLPAVSFLFIQRTRVCVNNFPLILEPASGIEPESIAYQAITLPLCYTGKLGAGGGVRSHDLNFGKVALYH